MYSWAEYMGKLSGYYDIVGNTDAILSVIGIVAKTSIANILGNGIFVLADILSNSPWLFAGLVACQVESSIYTTAQNYIKDQTYFMEGMCYFTSGMRITGTMSTVQYNNTGKKMNSWGR